jgi:3,2-trans-enoyl-CoA isomerase
MISSSHSILLNLSRRGLSPTSSTSFLVSAQRGFSTTNPSLISVTKDAEHPQIAVVSLAKKPVNSLNYDLLKELNDTIASLEADRSVRAMILTSSIPRIYSAGLDITEMYNPKPGRIEDFWTQLQKAWMNIYGTRLATAAAINGQTLAGGCLFAMACDYRVMAEGNYGIGLNETKLGIVAPSWFIDTMVNTIGQRVSDRMLQTGALIPSSEALKVGLVDELAPEGEVINRAKKELVTNWLTIPDQARYFTKLALRKQTIEKLAKVVDSSSCSSCYSSPFHLILPVHSSSCSSSLLLLFLHLVSLSSRINNKT